MLDARSGTTRLEARDAALALAKANRTPVERLGTDSPQFNPQKKTDPQIYRPPMSDSRGRRRTVCAENRAIVNG